MVRRRGRRCRCGGGIYHFDLVKGSLARGVSLSSCFLPLRSTSVAFKSSVETGEAGGGEGRKVAQ